MKRFLELFVCLSLAFVGCSGVNQYHVPSVDGHEVFSAKIVSRFESKIPNPYYFWPEGWWQDQRQLINPRFRSMLEKYANRRSGAASGRVVDLLVTLEEVSASFDFIGRQPRVSPHQYAVAPGAVIPAGAEAAWASRAGQMSLVHGIDGGGGGLDDAPYEATKTVVLNVTVEIQLDSKRIRTETLAAEASITVMQYEYYDRAYDYDDVLDIAMARAILQIDRILSEVLSAT